MEAYASLLSVTKPSLLVTDVPGIATNRLCRADFGILRVNTFSIRNFEMKNETLDSSPMVPILDPPAETVPQESDSVIQSPEIGRIVEVTIAEVNAVKQAELDRAARIANAD